MILTDVKNYLAHVKTASILQIAAHFKLDINVTRNLLQHWVKKKTICVRHAKCNDCSQQCQGLVPEVYQWLVNN